MRVISGLVLAILVYFGVWHLSSAVFSLIILAVSAYACFECLQLFAKNRSELVLAEMCGVVLASFMLFGSLQSVLLFFVLALFILGLAVMDRASTLAGNAERYALQCFAVCYISFTLPMFSWLHQLEHGKAWVLLAIAGAALSDTFAMMAGKILGKHPFSPMMSPKKSWEGYVGALLGSCVGALLVWYFALQGISYLHALALGVIIWITGPFGDLIESMLKRSAGVKDSGNLIPGHGGILDRLDALIFTGPAIYWYVTTFVQ